ncbi:hypothetical protein SSPIM334S_07565 [Streptomyces spiroverticillatus]
MTAPVRPRSGGIRALRAGPPVPQPDVSDPTGKESA